MSTSTITTTIATILVGATIALVPSALGQDGSAGPSDPVGSPAQAREQIVLRLLRRDQAVQADQADPVAGAGDNLVLRRDGSKAVPFVAEIGSEADRASSGFDFGNAVVVVVIVLGLILLGTAALLLVRRGRPGVQSRIPRGRASTRPRTH